MQLQRRDVLKGLKKKGFREDETCNRDHTVLAYFDENGRDSGISTGVSRGTKYREIRDDLLVKMARQCRLERKEEFRDLVNCPMSREEYERRLARVHVLAHPRTPDSGDARVKEPPLARSPGPANRPRRR